MPTAACRPTTRSPCWSAARRASRPADGRLRRRASQAVCADLAAQLLADAEGATKEVAIEVIGAASEDDAVEVGRAIARNNLLKCALFGNDPNWGRVLAAIGTTQAAFEPDELDVAINGDPGLPGGRRRRRPRPGRPDRPRTSRSWSTCTPAPPTATIWTNDLSHAYVEENSAYSS